MLWGAYLGVFHAGVEWKFWPGTPECSGAATFGPAGGLLNRLQDIVVVRCDEAAWRFLGISLAGYNAVISAALAVVALARRESRIHALNGDQRASLFQSGFSRSSG